MTRITSQNAGRHYEILVIGAGMSALACASKLYRHDYFKKPGRLLVLEARHRIGGRIESVVVESSRLDTGANWIHGIGTPEKPNPLMELMAKRRYRPLSGVVAFKAPTRGFGSESTLDTDSKSTSRSLKNDSQVIDKDIATTITESLFETLSSLHIASAEMTPEEAKQATIYQSILDTDSFKETFKDLPIEYHGTFGAMLQFVESIEAGPLTERYIERPEGKPSMSMLEYAVDDFEGDQVFVQDGYASAINDLAKDLIDAGLVKLNAEVTHIDWSSNPIRIHAGHGVFTADQVVCTLPLGVLKDRKPNLFYPSLPCDKEEAVQKLGFGTLDKVFLVYEAPWWTKDPYLSILKKGFVEGPWGNSFDMKTPDTLMGFTEDLPGFCINEDGTTSAAPCDMSVVNLYNLAGFPALSCFFSCSNAVLIEQMTTKEAGEMMHRSLNTWFGQDTPKPSAVHVTRWAQDQYSKGSYSHMIAGVSEIAHRVSFQEPIVNKNGAILRFAGEHTCRNHFATVHGAYISGQREANAILQQMHLA